MIQIAEQKDDSLWPKVLLGVLCALPWIAGSGIIVWIMFLRFPLNGVFTAESDMTGQSAFVFPFLPAERTSSPGVQPEGWTGQRVFDDPVYMNVRTPGPYRTAEVSMDFRPLRQSLLEFGLVKDAEGKDLELYPWYSALLEAPGWEAVSSTQGIKGYVLSGVPASRLDAKDMSGLAIWDTSTTAPLLADRVTEEMQTIKYTLRGAHDFWFVPNNGRVYLQLQVQDVNRNRSGGILTVQASRDGQTLWQTAVGTSGSQDKGYGGLIPVTVDLKDLSPGVYRIRVTADDDVFIRSMATDNLHWTIGPRLVSGDVVGYAGQTDNSLKVYTTARHIVAETFHKEGLQTVELGSATGKVERTHTAVRIDRTDSGTQPVILSAPRGDIRLIGDGYFAFIPEAFFEPQPRRLTDQTSDHEGLSAVLTPYVHVEDLGDGWKRAHLTFDIPPDLDTLRFVLSAPGIASRGGAVDIRQMQVVFRRPPLTIQTWWSLLIAEAKRAWHRL